MLCSKKPTISYSCIPIIKIEDEAGESVGNVRTVMAFNSQKKVVELVRSALREPERSNLLRGNIAGFCLGVAEFAKFGVHGLILGYGLILVKSGTCDFEGVHSSGTIEFSSDHYIGIVPVLSTHFDARGLCKLDYDGL